MLFGLACCAIELMQTGGPRADLDRGASGLSIGVVTQLVDSPDTDAPIRAAVREAADMLRRLGSRVEDVDLPLLPLAGAVFMALADGEVAGGHRHPVTRRWNDGDVIGGRWRTNQPGKSGSALVHQSKKVRGVELPGTLFSEQADPAGFDHPMGQG